MARYGTDNQARAVTPITNKRPTAILENWYHPNKGSGMTIKGNSNKCADPIIRTDATSKDMIWSKSVPSSWEQQSPNWKHAVPTQIQGASVRFSDEAQYVSDTESEHSCSSADTMILMNGGGNHVQDTAQRLDSHGHGYPTSALNVTKEGLPSRNEFALLHNPYNSTPGTSKHNDQSDYVTPALNNRLGPANPSLHGLKGANRSSHGQRTSAPPGGDNHSDDGYESNDTNMSFETGSSGSLCSKDSGQNGETGKPKSILKKSGKGESKPREWSVRFAGDGENDKHLETRTSHVPRQYVPSKVTDVIPSVAAVKRTVEKTEEKDLSTPSLEDRLKVLMVDEKHSASSPALTERNINGAYHPVPSQSDIDFGANQRAHKIPTRQQQYEHNGTNQVASEQRRTSPFVKPPSLSTIQEQPVSPERRPAGHSSRNDMQVNGFAQQPRDYFKNSYDDVDHNDYISSDQVKMLLNAQSNLRRSIRGNEHSHVSGDGRRMTHHSSMTNLPSQSQHPASVRQMSHHASLMQLGPDSRNENSSHVQTLNNVGASNCGVPRDFEASTRSWRDPEHEREYHSVPADLSSPEMSRSRQRHSYATYNDLTEMYKSMASGQNLVAPSRNRRYSNSSELSLSSVNSVRPGESSTKPKVVYGTTADLYRMMKNQIRQPTSVFSSDNSIT